MAASLQILVYDRQQKVYGDVFAGTVELGRQRDGKEALYTSRQDGSSSRVVIARLDEDTVSREHARIEPLPSGHIKLTNTSAKVSIRLPNGAELRAQTSCELTLPAVIALGRKTVRIQGSEVRETPLRGLPDMTPPGSVSLSGSTRFPTISFSNALSAPNTPSQMEEVIRWLQTTMEVLQTAASSSDFFKQAAKAVVEIVGLDRGRVMLYQDEEWVAESTWSASHINPDTTWDPSQQVLNQVRQEKKTFWQAPDHSVMDQTGSLLGVEIVVASPILNPQGEVIGAIYGDCRQDNMAAATPEITKLEAMLVELLARGVAVGLARMEQERLAVAARVQFEQFFTPELSRQLALQPDLLEGRDAEVSLLFCDIRGFSRVSEKLGPEGTVKWVSNVMGTLSDCVLNHRGVLVDYIGDELLAMWGAPEKQDDHATLACRAALDMLRALPALNDRFSSILGEQTNIGIGINTGLARVGNTGSRHKFKYGPLGHTVNLASRVQGATKYLRCRLLVTEWTLAKLDAEFHARRLCQVRVVNIKSPVNLYELVLPNHPHWPDMKVKYEKGLEEFDAGNFRPAARVLGNLLAEMVEDGPSMVLMSRAVNAWVDGPADHHPVWDLPGK